MSEPRGLAGECLTDDGAQLTAVLEQALVVFDLDGTLLRGCTLCEVLAKALNQSRRMQEIERLSARSEIAAAREEMAQWYSGTPRDELIGFLDHAELAPGARAGIGTLRRHGVTVAIASITWSFGVRHFADLLGVEHILATQLHASGEIEHVWAEHKARWVLHLAESSNIPFERTAAVGDSAGDHAMLDVVRTPFFVGSERPPDRVGWLHWPNASIDALASHLLELWQVAV